MWQRHVSRNGEAVSQQQFCNGKPQFTTQTEKCSGLVLEVFLTEWNLVKAQNTSNCKLVRNVLMVCIYIFHYLISPYIQTIFNHQVEMFPGTVEKFIVAWVCYSHSENIYVSGCEHFRKCDESPMTASSFWLYVLVSLLEIHYEFSFDCACTFHFKIEVLVFRVYCTLENWFSWILQLAFFSTTISLLPHSVSTTEKK